MSTEYYNCGISDILKMTCIGPYETEKEACENSNRIWWTTNPATLGVFKYQPEFTKNIILHFKHTYATTGINTFKP